MDADITRALETDRTIDITTTGRKSGSPRKVEIWFHNVDGRIYITGTPGTRDWYANMVANSAFTFHLKRTVQADIPATAVLPQNLQAAWAQELTTAAAIASALSAAQGKQIPWPIVSTAIEGAIRGRLLERTEDSGQWPCDWTGAAKVRLRIPDAVPPTQPPLLPPSGRIYAEAELEPAELQDLVDGLGDIVKAGAGLDLRFVIRVELSEETTDSEQVATVNEALAKVSAKLRIQ